MIQRQWLGLSIVLSAYAFIALQGCGAEEEVQCETVLEQPVTYSTDVQPLFEAKCTYCHNHEKTGLEREGAPSGVDYTTYATAVVNALGALDEARSATMPPSCEACPPVPNSEQTNLLCNWIKQGTPE
jgi:uncharacterized membrane protein